MENKEKIYAKKIGKNIKALRNIWGRSVTELANYLGISNNSVYYYESGDKCPRMDKLVLIAKYFRITETELIHVDYSKKKSIQNISVFDTEKGAKFLKENFPMVHTEESLKNEKFLQAFKLHKDFINLLISGEIDMSAYDRCIELYKGSYDEGVIEGLANATGLLLIIGLCLSSINPRMLRKIKNLRGQKAFIKDVGSVFLYDIFDEDDDEMNEILDLKSDFLDEYGLDLYVNIAVLKKSDKYHELGDFSLVLCYLCNLIETGLTPEMNLTIGMELISKFMLFRNKYIIRINS